MRELSSVMPFCRFCHFLIYISVRFVYVSFTFLFHSLYPPRIARIPAMPFLPCHSCHSWQVIDFKRFFLAKTLAKTCHVCQQNAKLLILKGFFIVKCVMSLLYNTVRQIIITSYPPLLACTPLLTCCWCVLLAC